MVLDSQITEFSIHVGIEKHWGNVCPQFKLVLSQYARTSQKTEGLPVKIRWGGGGSLEFVQFVVRLTYTMPQNSCCDIGKKKKHRSFEDQEALSFRHKGREIRDHESSRSLRSVNDFYLSSALMWLHLDPVPTLVHARAAAQEQSAPSSPRR